MTDTDHSGTALDATTDEAAFRLKFAIGLLNIYECSVPDAEYGARMIHWLQQEHDGDCTRKPYTCDRCVAEQHLEYANKMIAYLDISRLSAIRKETIEMLLKHIAYQSDDRCCDSCNCMALRAGIAELRALAGGRDG